MEEIGFKAVREYALNIFMEWQKSQPGGEQWHCQFHPEIVSVENSVFQSSDDQSNTCTNHICNLSKYQMFIYNQLTDSRCDDITSMNMDSVQCSEKNDFYIENRSRLLYWYSNLLLVVEQVLKDADYIVGCLTVGKSSQDKRLLLDKRVHTLLGFINKDSWVKHRDPKKKKQCQCQVSTVFIDLEQSNTTAVQMYKLSEIVDIVTSSFNSLAEYLHDADRNRLELVCSS